MAREGLGRWVLRWRRGPLECLQRGHLVRGASQSKEASWLRKHQWAGPGAGKHLVSLRDSQKTSGNKGITENRPPRRWTDLGSLGPSDVIPSMTARSNWEVLLRGVTWVDVSYSVLFWWPCRKVDAGSWGPRVESRLSVGRYVCSRRGSDLGWGSGGCGRLNWWGLLMDEGSGRRRKASQDSWAFGRSDRVNGWRRARLGWEGASCVWWLLNSQVARKEKKPWKNVNQFYFHFLKNS